MKDLLHNRHMEMKRSSESSKIVSLQLTKAMDEEIARLEPAWIKKALLASIKEQEKIRSMYIVEKHRAQASEQPIHTEIPSNPIIARPDFNKTSHHRDYAAVRCICKLLC